MNRRSSGSGGSAVPEQLRISGHLSVTDSLTHL
jgi:hypothetical protein